MRRPAIRYSNEEMAWLEANRAMVISDYHKAFVAAFGRDDIGHGHLHSLRKRKGWKVGRVGGRYVGRHRKFSAEEITWLSENRSLVISQYHEAFVKAFGRADVSAPALNALRKRQGWRTGNTGQFAKGAASWNKGKPCAPGTGGLHPNARRTQFRKGERKGRANANYQPIGTERVTDEGYRQRKVHDGLPMQARWQLVQRIEWEAVHGPVPKGYALKCLDGNKLNCAPSNWSLVSRGVLSRLNGGRHKKRLAFDAAPAELKPTVMALAKLEQGLHEICRPEPNAARSASNQGGE